jgi:hypothetical protein
MLGQQNQSIFHNIFTIFNDSLELGEQIKEVQPKEHGTLYQVLIKKNLPISSHLSVVETSEPISLKVGVIELHYILFGHIELDLI